MTTRTANICFASLLCQAIALRAFAQLNQNCTVNPTPTGSFQIPDVTINSSTPVAVVVQASNVPLGTLVHLQFYSENAQDLTLDMPRLAGTIASSQTTANVKFPSGFSHGFVTATF